jgi:hypothetical protein
MRKNAEKVLNAFCNGMPCNGQTIHTDGITLYSYRMKIGERFPHGVTLLEYSNAPTATTRSHVRAAEVFFYDRIIRRF